MHATYLLFHVSISSIYRPTNNICKLKMTNVDAGLILSCFVGSDER